MTTGGEATPATAGGVPELCVGALVRDGDALLLVRRGHGPAAGEWSVPGGRLERGETLAEAVVRELAEETGLEGVCDRFVGWVERIDAAHHFVILEFAVTVIGGELRAGSDAAEVAWVADHELASYSLVAGLLEFLHEHGFTDTIV